MTARKPCNKSGAALFSVLAIVVVMSVMLAATVTASMQRVFSARKLADRTHASTIAEAGANWAYSVLVTNFSARYQPERFPKMNYAGGTFDVGVVPVGTNVAVIHCTGTYAQTSWAVILDVKNYAQSIPGTPPSDAYNCQILVDKTITWQGASEFFDGHLVHGNGAFTQGGSGYLDTDVSSSVSIRINGSSGWIGGDGYAPAMSGKTGNIRGTKYIQPVPLKTLPTLDLTRYYNRALANGEVFSGTVTIGSRSPVGGIMWVNGSIKMTGGAVNGCFIATGNIDITGGTQQKVAGYPAFVSRDGAIKVAGNCTLHGLIYARIGNIDFTGGGSLTGSVVCGGDFKKAGTSTIFAYENSAPVGPGEEGRVVDCIAVTAWQK